ncbi:MAG: hypothetical protein KAR38_12500, partial [Calditrichia bacterium]|nr:hypothetical protein [Calditrichia bacterium]
MRYLLVFSIMTFVLLMSNCQNGEQKVKQQEDIAHIQAQVNKFVPVKIDFDRTILPENEMQALKKIVQAAQYMDIIFQKQVYAENEKIEENLKNNPNSDQKFIYDYFKINFGPFDRLEHDKPFIGKKEKPAGANYYPEDMTKEEF